MIKEIEQYLKKIFLKILLLIVKNPNYNNSYPEITSNTKVLFIRLNRIGDALVSTPLIDLLKKKTDCKIFVLADKKNHFVFSNNPNINEITIFQKGLKGFIAILKFIKNNEIDILVDLHDDVSTTVTYIVALANVNYKFGLNKINKEIYSHIVPRLDASTNHIIDRILKLTELFNISYSKDEIKIGYYPKDENIRYANQIIDNKFSEKKFLLGINISAGSKARFWGVEKFIEIIDCVKKYNINIILFSELKDYNKAKSIIDENFIYPVSKDFDKFVAGVLCVDLLFSPDTSVVHIASIKRIPVFGLYVKFNTKDMIWSPYNTSFEYVITEESTLKNISVDEVKEKFIPFLEEHLKSYKK